jgi:hypothetical protein
VADLLTLPNATGAGIQTENQPLQLLKALGETRKETGAGTLGRKETTTRRKEGQAAAVLRKKEAVKAVARTTNARERRLPRTNRGRLYFTLSHRSIVRRTSTRGFIELTRIATWTPLSLLKYRKNTSVCSSKISETLVNFYSAWVRI